MIMLKLIDIHKTFNPGTINEKVALNGVDLHLNEGDFVLSLIHISEPTRRS